LQVVMVDLGNFSISPGREIFVGRVSPVLNPLKFLQETV